MIDIINTLGKNPPIAVLTVGLIVAIGMLIYGIVDRILEH